MLSSKREIVPAVIEFREDNPFFGIRWHYFVGVTVDAILADTYEGTRFDHFIFSSRREISIEEAEKLGLDFFPFARQAIIRQTSPFYIGTSNNGH